MASAAQNSPKAPPIVYTIAGSDSGGGAGIQADLHAIKAMGGHGCSAIAALTAQNSVGVTAVHAPPIEFLRAQLDALVSDLFPRGIKIGMLGTKEVANLVGEVLKEIKEKSNDSSRVWVVLDPVMISTSGSKLIDDDAVHAIIKNVFPYADVVTPNKFEAEALLGRKLKTPEDVQKGAQDILAMGCKGVLIKGGHTLTDENDATSELKATITYAQDYLLTNEELPKEADRRLCDSASGIWLRTKRWDTENTHGTGCTLSSAFATALALGEAKRQDESSKEGATSSIYLSDACCLAKAYVSAGIQQGVQLGAGPGPVVQTTFPSSYEHFPSIIAEPTSDLPAFPPMKAFSAEKSDDDGIPVLGRILPIVDTVDWIRKLAESPGVEDIQLRIKDETDASKIAERVQACQDICAKEGVRLWINDYWEAAVQAGCFGVHVGQEDLLKCKNAGGLEKLREKGMALGISTHSYGELAAAIGIKPSYISLGPIFATSSKKVGFDPQGLGILSKWRDLIPPSIPFVTIGGINTIEAAISNKQAGSDCIAVIGAVTKAENLPERIQQLNEAML
eukprot:CAMPEP_0113645278 /NCGR_PEP_ID=MMETSP0017_2-20120614/23857_1 /TAXON_ID=2856 /ORGANISM="Cylindrotheca closterium" /LENGTH=563 /DNA_ID=CAMNT_0000556987 /DNA_START=67 /DNA_END=1758 /DNA_ORIENTATION=+ /assembly_acc=CAM_ASM_000147